MEHLEGQHQWTAFSLIDYKCGMQKNRSTSCIKPKNHQEHQCFIHSHPNKKWMDRQSYKRRPSIKPSHSAKLAPNTPTTIVTKDTPSWNNSTFSISSDIHTGTEVSDSSMQFAKTVLLWQLYSTYRVFTIYPPVVWYDLPVFEIWTSAMTVLY